MSPRPSPSGVRVGARAALAGLAILGLAAPVVDAQQPPRFRSSVEVTSVDVTVVGDRGRPVSDLKAEEFIVRINGLPRRVVSAEWVPLATPEGAAAPPPPEGYSSNANATGGRLILIAIDQPNIRFGGALAIRTAVESFIDRLQPSDRIAVLGFGPGSASTPFTADRERLKEAIGRMTGQRQSSSSMLGINVALSEAMSMERGEFMVRDRVVRRECGAAAPTLAYEMCVTQVEADASGLVRDGRLEARQTIEGLRHLLIGLRTVDAPKTLVLISEGFLLEEQEPSVMELGSLAAAARTSLYALKLDGDFFDMTRASAPTAVIQDRQMRNEGLDALAAAARGSMFNVVAAADPAFERIEAELGGYYLLGVESDPSDTDGKTHPIRVEVSRRGLTVRSRPQLTAQPDGSRPRTAREAVIAGLNSPLMLSALPLRVATFSLKGPELSKVQLLIHADVGVNYAAPRPVSVAYVIADGTGRIVESQMLNARLQPMMNGVPSALQFTAGASLDPGEYTLKLAATEGDLVGTVEHVVHATLAESDGVTFSELMVGGPIDPSLTLQPTVGHTIAFGLLHAYLEAYGPSARELTATYEIAAGLEGAAILDEEVPVQPVGDDRAIFTTVLPVRQLPPGKYYLRASLSSAGAPIKTMARAFDIAAPAVLMTAAEAPAAGVAAPSEVFLPVQDQHFARVFRRDELTRGETLKAFRALVAPGAVGAFDRGVAAFRAGDYVEAEVSFKAALQTDADSTAALTYLAASFAASGHDVEAASAWQTALIGGADLPQIYLWLGDALMRTRELGPARTILEEALAKWPSDVRFTKPLALLYATFGQGREAVRTLARHLEADRDDREALFLGVEWIYILHSSGAVARTRAEDVKLARSYAETYARAKGPEVELVKQWIEFLEISRAETR